MHKSNEDCFYFLTSSCAKGASCTYRHSPLALTCNVTCPAWTRGNCPNPACPYRHSQIQRPMVANGILCFYENTAKGCLKPECTFIHSKPRLHLTNNAAAIRPALTNPTKPLVNNVPSTSVTQVPEPKPDPTPSTSDKTVPETKTETITRRIAITSDTESSNDKKDVSESQDNNSNAAKSITRSVIADSKSEETTSRPRLVVNRNVLIGESTTNVSTRSVIPTTSSSSNRVVVSSDIINSSAKDKQVNVNSTDEEVETKKKFKASPNDTPLPNRILVLSSNEVTSTNDTKPIRLNRQRLLETKSSSGNSSPVVFTPSNEDEKASSPGTGLLQDSERRTMRLERFQKKPMSPLRSITTPAIETTDGTSSRNVITSSTNDRKRTAPSVIAKETPPAKRLANPSTISNKNSVKQANESTTRPTISPTKSMPSAPERPRFVPQLITPPTTTTTSPRIRQPPSVVIKRALGSETASSSTSAKPTNKISSNTTGNHTPAPVSSNLPNEEDENQLLKLNESTDIVDTFALIDEALLEADHLLELM